MTRRGLAQPRTGVETRVVAAIPNPTRLGLAMRKRNAHKIVYQALILQRIPTPRLHHLLLLSSHTGFTLIVYRLNEYITTSQYNFYVTMKCKKMATLKHPDVRSTLLFLRYADRWHLFRFIVN